MNYLALDGLLPGGPEEALADPWAFLANYPVWVQGQDTLHIGTHPPGLIALQCVLLGAWSGARRRRHPDSVHAELDGRRFPAA